MAKAKHYKAIAEYYDAEYATNEMLQEDVPFFLGHLPKRRQAVLELATGTARAAIPIAQAGHRVVGVDFDGDVLAIGQRKQDAVGIKEKDLRLVKADALGLVLGQTFDWVCIFFNTFLNFASLEDQDRLLQTVRRHMKPNGRFWLDIFNPDLHRLAQDHVERLEPSSFFVPSLDRSVYREMEVEQDPVRQVQKIQFHYLWFDKHGQEHRERIAFELTWVFPRELQILLERNGLWIEHLYGNYDGSKLRADSPRIIAVCRQI
jgi:SAM-dependent methyltransferase